jgi:hypothetical protein
MKTTKASLAKAPQGTRDNVPVKDLHFDTRNPRLVEYGVTAKTSPDDILEILWEKMAVDEIAMSIAASGFWDYEPLFVVKERGVDVVIEGNRRLAAVKVLRSRELQNRLKATDLPEASAKDLESLASLPVLRVPKREEVWRYLGFKHVNGPAKWRSYAKAQYIAFVHKTTDEPLEAIAAQIGDRHRTVQRLYRSLMVIEQAERAGVYKRDCAYRRQLAFSHLMTALDYEGFARFLKLADKSQESTEPVSKDRLKELGEVCRWLWGDNRDDTKPLIVSQNPNLRQLDQILAHPQALATLRLGHGLDAAFEVSKGDDVVFEESLQDAKNALVKAQGRVSSGYKGEPHLLELANTILSMADDLASVMHAKANKLRKRRRVGTESEAE